MPIAFACRHCKTGIVIPRGDAGRWGKCPACGGLVQAPLNEPPQAYGASAGPGMTASSDPDTATYTAPTTFDPSSSGDPDAATRLASAPIFDTADPDVAKPPKPEGTVARSSASLARSSSGRVTQSGELAQALSLEVEQARADPARRFGPFVILSELGKGGMGVVYRAWNDKLRRQVALKTILTGPDVSQEVVQRFHREAEAVARLRHPNIVSVHEAGEVEGKHFIAMDYVPGETLERRLEAPPARRLALTRALEALGAVARAVHHAHQQGVVHRDLKPANIMIVEEATGLASRQCSAFVLDFGLASIRDSGTRVTKTGMSMGTPAYMPPEQASGEPADERSDVYSLGATLYHVLTGRPPFAGSSDVNLVVAVLTKDPTPPGRVNPRAAGDLETIAMKCLEKEPEKRYESAAALADDLDRHLRGEPISARPLGPLARLARRARRNKAITALLALLLLTVAGGAGALAQARARAEARLVHEARDRALRASADLELRRKSSRGAATQGFQDLLALALASYEAALSYADHARSDEARATAFDAAIALGDVALEGEQWSLASSAYSRARSLGVDAARDDRAAKALGQVEARRVAVQQSHRQVVLETIATVGSTKPLYDHDAALFTLVRLSEPQTVRLLGEELDRITALLQRAKRDVYLAAAEPDADEARNGVRPIDGLAAAIDDSLALSPGTEPARAVAEILKEAEERLLARQGRAGYRTPVATLVATSQERALGEARIQVAKLLCEALGWIGTKEGAIGPLSRYLEAENDEQRAIPAGMALCQLADVEAVRIATVSRHYAGSSYQTQVRRVVDRLGTRTSVDASSVTDLCARSRSRFELGDFPGALADATRALELDPRCGRAWQLRGAARDRTGDVDGAIADLSRAAELAPNALVFMNRGQALGQKGDTDAAIEDFSRAISLDPGLAHAWYNRGVARQRKRDLEGALADASRALELDPRSVEALVLRAECRSLAQDQDGALADLAQATAIDPRHSPAWVLRGRLRRLRNDLDGALADMTRAIELDPKDAAAWGERGIVRREKHDHEGAIADFTRALELRPDDVDGLDSRADSYFRLGKNEAAIADLDRAVKVAPGDAATWEHRGRSRAEIGDTEGALADLARAIELAPRRPDAWNTRGIVKDSYLRDREGAIADFTRAIELDPRFSQAHEGRAWARFRAGEYDLAIADATRAIEIAPSRASARVVRGGARSNKGELELAIADLARATELDPRGAEAFDFLGNTLVRHGDSGRALEAFTRALELDPRMADAWRGRGVLKRDVLHDEKGAASDLARYVELRPDAKDADAWRAEIRKLRGE